MSFLVSGIQIVSPQLVGTEVSVEFTGEGGLTMAMTFECHFGLGSRQNLFVPQYVGRQGAKDAGTL